MMTSSRSPLAMTSLGLHYDCDYDDEMGLPPITGGSLDRDFMRINVFPPPLQTRSSSETRKFCIPQTDADWIQMVNRFNNGHQEMYYPSKSVYSKPPGPKPIRSISANSYFDPFTLRTDVSGSTKARDVENGMTRVQMERAYQRACAKSTAGARYRELPSNYLREFPRDQQRIPILRTSTMPFVPRYANSSTSESGYCTGDETKKASTCLASQQREQNSVRPNPLSSPSSSRRADGNLPSKREAWYSAHYRAKIIKQSPPWRSLLNRRPQGMRASGELCPKYCRCCFKDTYDSSNKNIFKIDLT
ncbi:uncharacterized protein LOC121405933 [Lytechinus variegatus]|uniref:uncharacterized protein LOC121405933 n=1 Tax=Lytechinus variegatus TaxID=7654 RepID=UPI001BB0FBA9|nr:uncharacterized protein LOC121405933 [Lytechinus variegatus]